jgi:hypothetical protein
MSRQTVTASTTAKCKQGYNAMNSLLQTKPVLLAGFIPETFLHIIPFSNGLQILEEHTLHQFLLASLTVGIE